MEDIFMIKSTLKSNLNPQLNLEFIKKHSLDKLALKSQTSKHEFKEFRTNINYWLWSLEQVRRMPGQDPQHPNELKW